MDTFDIRKYITENKINDQEGYERRYLITFADGTDEEVGKHGSVSPEDIIGSLKKKYARQGKKVSDVKYLGEKPQGIYESDMGDAVEFYMNHYDENEMSQEIRDAISDALDSGKPLKWVKDQIKDGFLDMILPEGKVQDRIDSLVSYYEAETGNVASEDVEYEIEYMVSRGKFDDQIKANVLKEDKDVIEPDKDAVAAEKEEELYPLDYDEEKVEAILPSMEKKLATAVHSAYNPDEGSDLESPDIDQKYILSQIKAIRDNKDLYYQLINDRGEDEALKAISDKIILAYLKKYVEENDIQRTGQLGRAYSSLNTIFRGLTDMQKPARRIQIYIRNK